MSDKKYEIQKRETLFQGYFRVDRFHVRHERFAGGWTPKFTREVFDRGCDVIAVLPFDPVQDKVVLVEQFRAGVLGKIEHPWLMELVAGVIDPGEAREQAAQRETEEEAGCVVTELTPIMDYFPSPGSFGEHVSLFVGRITAPEHGSLHGLAHEDEDIRVHVLSAAQALGLLYANKVRDAATIIALQWFALHHTELRTRWLMGNTSTPII